ncbi:hypothetical protein [Paenibacillus sp. KS-LC4]|uniref:hypothetical protein n=1 Tax=Paenibacillus sp. KS-LC4 TaxID=2979727 RepID=UPI0030D620E0
MPVKILPVEVKQIIDSYWFYSDFYSIISRVDSKKMWFINNYINLFDIPDPNQLYTFFYNGYYRDKMVEFYDCPFIEFQRLAIDRTSSTILNNDLFDFIKASIDGGYYVIVMIERFYIKEYEFSLKSPHEVMINGYDDVNKKLYFCDNNANGKYSTNITCDYEAFSRAFHLLEIEAHDFKQHLYLLKPLENNNYTFSLKYVKNTMKAYLLSRAHTDEYYNEALGTPGLTFGINVYDKASDYLKYLAQEEVVFDIRSFHLLYDHKKCMTMRLDYMINNKHLLDDNQILNRWRKLEADVLAVRNSILKYWLTRSPEALYKQVEQLQKLKETEMVLLREVVEQLEER